MESHALRPLNRERKSHYLAGFHAGKPFVPDNEEQDIIDGYPHKRGTFSFHHANIFRHLNCEQDEVQILYTCEESTVWLGKDTFAMWDSDGLHFGHLEPEIVPTFTQAFGDNRCMHGCLDNEGAVWTLTTEAVELVQDDGAESADAMQIENVVEAGDRKVCISRYDRNESAATLRIDHIMHQRYTGGRELDYGIQQRCSLLELV